MQNPLVPLRGASAPLWMVGLGALALLPWGCGGGGGGGGNDSSALSSAGTSQSGIRSTNFSGYQLAGGPGGFKKTTASWTVPEVQASSTDTASSTFAGIGGGCTNPPDCTVVEPSLIQAGTEQDNSGGKPTYFAWWEALPLPQVQATGGPLSSDTFDVLPGDVITVTVDGTNLIVWNITIANQRNGSPHWTFNTSVPYVAAALTVEWIVESPLTFGSGGAGQIQLSDFDRVSFFGLTANGAKVNLDPNQRITMTDGHGNVLANPSAPSGSGDAFSVCFGPALCD